MYYEEIKDTDIDIDIKDIDIENIFKASLCGYVSTVSLLDEIIIENFICSFKSFLQDLIYNPEKVIHIQEKLFSDDSFSDICALVSSNSIKIDNLADIVKHCENVFIKTFKSKKFSILKFTENLVDEFYVQED